MKLSLAWSVPEASRSNADGAEAPELQLDVRRSSVADMDAALDCNARDGESNQSEERLAGERKRKRSHRPLARVGG
jgi:hypothetical protein